VVEVGAERRGVVVGLQLLLVDPAALDVDALAEDVGAAVRAVDVQVDGHFLGRVVEEVHLLADEVRGGVAQERAVVVVGDEGPLAALAHVAQVVLAVVVGLRELQVEALLRERPRVVAAALHLGLERGGRRAGLDRAVLVLVGLAGLDGELALEVLVAGVDRFTVVGVEVHGGHVRVLARQWCGEVDGVRGDTVGRPGAVLVLDLERVLDLEVRVPARALLVGGDRLPGAALDELDLELGLSAGVDRRERRLGVVTVGVELDRVQRAARDGRLLKR
jgi:hypothetical protein